MHHSHLSVVLFSFALAACTLDRVPTGASVLETGTATGSSPHRPPGVSAQTSARLFTNAPGEPAIDTSRETGVVRNRYVGVDLAILSTATPGRTIGLNLFEDVLFNAVVDSVETSGPGSSTIVGHLDGLDGSTVTIVTSEGVVIGSITAAKGQYQIRYAGNGVHAVREFDTSQLPREHPPQSPTRRPPPTVDF
jgi:hypothetical protein